MGDVRDKLYLIKPWKRSTSKITQERNTKSYLSIQLTLLFCVSFPVTSPSLTHGNWNAFLLQNQTKYWNFYVLKIARKFTNICASSKNSEKQTMMLKVDKFLSDLQKTLVCKAQNAQYFLASLHRDFDDKKQHRRYKLYGKYRHSEYFLRKPVGFSVVERKNPIWFKFKMSWAFQLKMYVQKQFNINITFLTFNLFYNCYSNGPGEAVLVHNVTQNVTMTTFCGKRPPWTMFLPCHDLEIVFKTGRKTKSYFTFGFQIIENQLKTTQFELIEKAHWQILSGVRQIIVHHNQKMAHIAKTLLFVVQKLKFVQVKLTSQLPQTSALFILDGPGSLSKRIHFNNNTVTCSSFQCTAVCFEQSPDKEIISELRIRALKQQTQRQRLDHTTTGALKINMTEASCLGEASKTFCTVWLESEMKTFINVTMIKLSYKG